MISVRRRGSARLTAAVLASGLAAAGAIATASPAVADDAVPHKGGATATLAGLKTYDQVVIHHQGRPDQKLSGGLFELTVDGGGSLLTYCIDIKNPTQQRAKYNERSWAETSLHDNNDAGKINWILQNSYPQVNDLAALAQKAGSGALTEKTAAAGTQVAIWRFSDHADVEAVDPAAEKLADYLEQSAENLDEPGASLHLDPPAVSGKAGDLLGPIKVATNAGSVTVAPAADAADAGIKIVDADGKPVTNASNGAELFFQVPAGAEPGSASAVVKASTKVEIGRAFASDSKSQTMILAGSSESTVSATATANWAKQGPIPALSAEENCAKGGVDISAANKGDEPFTFELAGEKHTVEAGKSETITVPVEEDQAYEFTIKGPNGFEKTFSGVLDCETAGVDTDEPSSEPSPASVGGSSGDLAETGSSDATPVIAGVAIALVVLGGGTVFFLRRKKAVTAGE
ncbi:Cys-Gln thioester bond-forming surface protein [Streptomyces sp. TP-A0874]|uniref:Cys-Gln thioester bond-forming surface protein n=1 Tax=Streptomyces sp. TP-A0874 TaxID=549819 RepID=UPI000853E525|nr:Cys-Gln thioester bond-forming surface protein [Streptomyces sp. TP-A0874]